jgi:alpha-L-arabinofuranosidase
VSGGESLPGGAAAVSGTASQRAGSLAVTVINRHYHQPAEVVVKGARSGSARAELLAADAADAGNSPSRPDAVAPASLAVNRDGDAWRIELLPHSMATVMFEG